MHSSGQNVHIFVLVMNLNDHVDVKQPMHLSACKAPEQVAST
jgi:hypothetical protein